MLTKQQILDDGAVLNPNCWIGDAWIYCDGCKQYTYHAPYSRRIDGAVFEICLQCDNYHGHFHLRGSNVTTAADILENAKELTQRYGEAILKDADAARPIQGFTPKSGEPIPSRVFVLLQSGTVLGVLTTEQKALDEAHSIMNASKGSWETLSVNRIWRTRSRAGAPIIIEISEHDAR